MLIYFITIYIDLLEFISHAMTLAKRRIIIIGCCESFQKVQIFFFLIIVFFSFHYFSSRKNDPPSNHFCMNAWSGLVCLDVINQTWRQMLGKIDLCISLFVCTGNGFSPCLICTIRDSCFVPC